MSESVHARQVFLRGGHGASSRSAELSLGTTFRGTLEQHVHSPPQLASQNQN